MNNLFSSPPLMWFFIGIVIMLLEFVFPGFVIFFFGVGAWCVALLSIFTPNMDMSIQIVLFLVFSVLSIFLLRKKFTDMFYGKKTDKKSFDDDIDNLVGEKVKVIQDIVPPNKGKVEFHGTNWNAEADSFISSGDLVEIISKNGLTLNVKKIS